MDETWENSVPAAEVLSGYAPADFRKSRKQKAQLADPTKVQRLPIHSTEAEQGVVGCALLAPNECLNDCILHFKAAGEEFYGLRERCIYQTMVAMYLAKKPIDLITLQQVLKDNNQLEGVGGLSYLASLPDAVPSAANLMYYVEIVLEKYRFRQVIALSTGIVGAAYEFVGDAQDFFDSVDHDFRKVMADIQPASSAIKSACDLMPDVVIRLEKLFAAEGKPIGIPSGFKDLNQMTGGFMDGELTIFAGRPGTGKTSYSLNVADHVAVDNKIPVGYFSLEMDGVSLGARMVSARAEVDLKDAKGWKDKDWDNISNASAKINSAPFRIMDERGISIMQLRANAKRMFDQFGIKILFVDYLQLLSAKTGKGDNREREISLITNGLRTLAGELKIPVVALAQLNRESERENRRPRMSDLREGGSCENDADLIGILYKPNASDDNPYSAVNMAPKIPVILSIVKNRNGPCGDIQMDFHRLITRFKEASSPTHEYAK